MDFRLRALIVDDSKVMRMMVIRALGRIRGVQWDYREANDGIEAWELFNSEVIDIGFIDWNMPNLNGVDLVRRLRASGKLELPLVMVTSEKTIARIEEATHDAGANAYICKPFTDEEMAQKIGGILESLHHRNRILVGS